MVAPSEMDKEFYRLAREHIANNDVYEATCLFMGDKVLEIGPQINNPKRIADEERAKSHKGVWHTLDVSPGCTYQADITKRTSIEDSAYSIVVCLDVLEHTVNPFAALTEIRRILRSDGILLASAPWNFRIHGPLPDCWRFSEHGWRVMLKDWDIIEIDALETPDRPLMPIHYNITARCNKTKDVDPRTIKWRWL